MAIADVSDGENPVSSSGVVISPLKYINVSIAVDDEHVIEGISGVFVIAVLSVAWLELI